MRGTFLRALGKQLVLVAVFIMKLICLSNEKGLRYFPQIMLFIRNLWVRCLDYLPLFGKRACAHRLSLLSKSRHFLLRRQKKKNTWLLRCLSLSGKKVYADFSTTNSQLFYLIGRGPNLEGSWATALKRRLEQGPSWGRTKMRHGRPKHEENLKTNFTRLWTSKA